MVLSIIIMKLLKLDLDSTVKILYMEENIN